MTPLLTVAIDAADVILESIGVHFDEAAGEYYYDTENVKRSIPDADACELCSDEADEGWIPDDDVFPNSGEDEPPFHINCKCGVEYKEKRVRVYV